MDYVNDHINYPDVFAVAEHLIAQHNAIKMLHQRVLLVLRYIQAVEAGTVPRDHEILREAHSLCHRLPVLNTSRFKQEFFIVSSYTFCSSVFGIITAGMLFQLNSYPLSLTVPPTVLPYYNTAQCTAIYILTQLLTASQWSNTKLWP